MEKQLVDITFAWLLCITFAWLDNTIWSRISICKNGNTFCDNIGILNDMLI